MSTTELLHSLVNYSLSAHLQENSIFFAERLFYESPSPEHLNLLAQCYFRMGKHKQTYLILQDAGGGLSEVNKYLLSLTCVTLDKLEEAEEVLRPRSVSSAGITVDALLDVPGRAAGVYLLGKICRKQQRRDMAIDYYKICLQMDPYMWCAITDLSEMGVQLNFDTLFGGALASGTTDFASLFPDMSEQHHKMAAQNRSNKLYNMSLAESIITSKGPTIANGRGSMHQAFGSSGGSCKGKNGEVETDGVIDDNGSFSAGGAASQRVSLALGLSSLSLQVPFPSPLGGMPLAAFGSVHSAASVRNSNSSSVHSSIHGPTGMLDLGGMHDSSLDHSGSISGTTAHDHDHHQRNGVAAYATAAKASNGEPIGRGLFPPTTSGKAGSSTESKNKYRDSHDNHPVDDEDEYRDWFGDGARGGLESGVGAQRAGSLSSTGGGVHSTGGKHIAASLFGGATPSSPPPLPIATGSGSLSTGITPLVRSMGLESEQKKAMAAVASVDAALSSHFAALQQQHSHAVALGAARRVSFGPNATAELPPDTGTPQQQQQQLDPCIPHRPPTSAGAITPSNAPPSTGSNASSVQTEESPPTDGEHPHKIQRTADETDDHSTPPGNKSTDNDNGSTGMGTGGLLLGGTEKKLPIMPGAPVRSTVKKSARRTGGEKSGGGGGSSSSSGAGGVNVMGDAMYDGGGYEYSISSQYAGGRSVSDVSDGFDRGITGGLNDDSEDDDDDDDDGRGSYMVSSMALFASGDGIDVSDTLSAGKNMTGDSILSPPFTLPKSAAGAGGLPAGRMSMSSAPPSAIVHSNSKFDPSFGSADYTRDDDDDERGGINLFHTGGNSVRSDLNSAGVTATLHRGPSTSGGATRGLATTGSSSAAGVKTRLFRQSLSPFPIGSSPILHGAATVDQEKEDIIQAREEALYNQKKYEQQDKYHSQQQQQQLQLGQQAPFAGQTRRRASRSGSLSSNNSDSGVIGGATASSVAATVAHQAEAAQYIVDLLLVFAKAHQLLASYRCRDSIDMLHTLPTTHFKSGLVNQMLGRAYYEMNEYKSSVLAYREMLRLEPFRLKGLEILSTALWHLKSEKDLCALAQQVVEVDKFAPETWCVVGNCFSLQREPDVAIKFFQRALQIEPTFAYAHTLCGHELVNNEDLEKAATSFRQAILFNERHYNAWYGLASLYYRQERYELSEYHFRRALSINSASSVLHCYLGKHVVLHMNHYFKNYHQK